MKHVIATLFLAAFAATANAEDVAAVSARAARGDYQAMRNLAYGYVAWPLPGQKKDAVQGCAWYLLVLRSESSKLNAGDLGNVKVYCDPLSFDERLAAERKANTVFRTWYR